MKKKTRLDILKELDEYKTFGMQLVEAMNEKGYSKSKLSEELSERKQYVPEKEIAAWQKDKRYPDITIIYMLCEILDMNPNDLLEAKQLMQEAGLSSINMQAIRVVCRVLDKSILFSYCLVKTLFWTALLSILLNVWTGTASTWGTTLNLNPIAKFIVGIIIFVAAAFGTYSSLL